MPRTLPTHPTLRHPRTGEPLQALYHTKAGHLVWPQMGGDGTDDDPAGDGGGEAKFTQADLDRLIDARLNRERAKYSDYDEVKAKAAKHDAAEAANQSELERERAARAKLEADLAAERTATQKVLRRSAIGDAATEAGAIDLDAVRALLADSDTITVKDGAASGATEAVAELKKAKPHLFKDTTAAGAAGRAGARGFDQGARGAGESKPSAASGAQLYADRHPKKSN
jgi:hypothetical protein